MTTSETIWVNESVAADIEMVAWGGYLPLRRLMDRATYESVVETMRLPDGRVFPLPVVLPLTEAQRSAVGPGDVVSVRSQSGLFASVEITDVFPRDVEREASLVYGTTDVGHPGVANLKRLPLYGAGGQVVLHDNRPTGYPEAFRPQDVKDQIRQKGWKTVAAFQIRNPVHRAHEYLHKFALEQCDGLLLHPLVGPTQDDDVPSDVRMQSYRIVIKHYYPTNRVILATFGAAMRYAGPREALFHAITRKNFGATHFIVGRDAAGVAGYYHPDHARQLIAAMASEIGIVPMVMPSVGYCPICEEITSEKRCPHVHRWHRLSGTEVRARLRRGETLPKEFTRPEVSRFLVDTMCR